MMINNLKFIPEHFKISNNMYLIAFVAIYQPYHSNTAETCYRMEDIPKNTTTYLKKTARKGNHSALYWTTLREKKRTTFRKR